MVFANIDFLAWCGDVDICQGLSSPTKWQHELQMERGCKAYELFSWCLTKKWTDFCIDSGNRFRGSWNMSHSNPENVLPFPGSNLKCLTCPVPSPPSPPPLGDDLVIIFSRGSSPRGSPACRRVLFASHPYRHLVLSAFLFICPF